jgi:hypothetical protein
MPVPNELLARLRNSTARLEHGEVQNEGLVASYVELFKALDEALSKGEPIPAAWTPDRRQWIPYLYLGTNRTVWLRLCNGMADYYAAVESPDKPRDDIVDETVGWYCDGWFVREKFIRA